MAIGSGPGSKGVAADAATDIERVEGSDIDSIDTTEGAEIEGGAGRRERAADGMGVKPAESISSSGSPHSTKCARTC